MYLDKLAYILVGLPACGKSTLTQRLLERHPDAFVYSTDSYIEQAAQVNGLDYNSAFSEFIKPATKAMKERLALAVRHGQTVIWDQTNLGSAKRRSAVQKLVDYHCVCVCIIPPSSSTQLDEWRYRLNSRPGKTIPDNIISSMQRQFEMPQAYEGYSTISYFDIWGKEYNQ